MWDEAQPTDHGANVAVIFGGGVGRRMNNRGKPKQFLELHQKPIIIHTLEQFEFHDQIDHIAIACVEPWIGHLKRLIRRYEISKVRWIVSGGETGQASIYNALQAVESDLGDVNPTVLIHDAVRPVIPASTISANIESVWEKGSGVTVAEARETILIEDADGSIRDVTERSVTRVAKAPQSFRLSDILAVHRQALAEGITDAIDSCSLMLRYGHRVWAIRGTHDNIKITTPEDFYVFRALADLSESSQILGLQ
ncbi:MAG: D-ribitol-5-phosphate cytidylyltransferase [Frankiaceae bacterium]|nr:D-ribitol-5-phosphate cytidylyltransferase [Frankiaceae bacterium]MDQ1635854.1 D-ribitol-5-phosphate cytidylyltransferase [Frankiaceae bacterium]MDQ1674598.1 D-ribitol-5-phosphate cytidylyltransferase [Frankiaceae bacterium]